MKLFHLLVFASIVTFVSCSKEKGCTDPMSIQYNPDAEEDDGSCQYAGQGGTSSIAAFPEHHGDPIVSEGAYRDSAFIKFNAKDSPGTDMSLYDMIVVGDSGEDHVHIEGLKPGYYWVEVVGWDVDTVQTERVSGGIGVKISSNGEEVDKKVPVTE